MTLHSSIYTCNELNYRSDYYPGGMVMPGRSFSSNSYRYGFNGMEKDDEVKGSGNSINYKYRMHDPRLGRFLSIDPLAPDFPWNSPYAFSENRVIDGIELEGRETYYYMLAFDKDGKSKLELAHTWEGKLFNAGWSNHVSYNGNDYFISAGSDFANWLFSWIPDTPDNSQWGRVSHLEGKTEEEIAAYFGAMETYEEKQARERAESEAAITQTLTDAITLKSLSSTKFKTQSTKPIKRSSKVPQNERFGEFGYQVRDGKLSFSNHMSTKGTHDVVITTNGKVLIGDGHYKMAGNASSVHAAGTITVNSKGVITSYSNNSGHYKSKANGLEQLGSGLKEAGFELKENTGVNVGG